MKRKNNRDPESQDALQLGEVLEPDEYDSFREENSADAGSVGNVHQEYDSFALDDDDPDDGRNLFQILYGLANGVGILVGAAIIFLLAALLIGVLHWLTGDISQFITVFENGLR